MKTIYYEKSNDLAKFITDLHVCMQEDGCCRVILEPGDGTKYDFTVISSRNISGILVARNEEA